MDKSVSLSGPEVGRLGCCESGDAFPVCTFLHLLTTSAGEDPKEQSIANSSYFYGVSKIKRSYKNGNWTSL